MKKEVLKEKIKKHFSTYTNFARLAGLDYYSFSRDFLNCAYPEKEYIETINALCDKLRDSDTSGAITASELRLLKKAIKERGGVIKFCRETLDSDGQPMLSESSVFKILAGNDEYRKSARKLIEHFKI